MSKGRVDWAKKPGKASTIKFVVDPAVPRDDVYKSSTVHVPKGLPPNSESRPTPRGRSSAAAPYPTQGYGTQSYAKPRTTPSTYPPQGRQPNGFVPKTGSQAAPARVPVTQAPASRVQPPPPPPPPSLPPAPIEPAEPIYRAMYDFQAQTGSELSFSKGDVLDISKKEGNGTFIINLTNI
jgi:myosin I